MLSSQTIFKRFKFKALILLLKHVCHQHKFKAAPRHVSFFVVKTDIKTKNE